MSCSRSTQTQLLTDNFSFGNFKRYCVAGAFACQNMSSDHKHVSETYPQFKDRHRNFHKLSQWYIPVEHGCRQAY